MKALVKILLIVSLFSVFPPASFSQENTVNGWAPTQYVFFSWVEKIGSILTQTSQDFYVSGGTLYNGDWHGQGLFLKVFPETNSLPDQITLDGQIKERSTSVSSIEILISLYDENGTSCHIRDKIQLVPLDGAWATLAWDITPEIKSAIKNIKTFLIAIRIGAADSCYVSTKTGFKNLKLKTADVEKILDFNFSAVSIEKDNNVPTNFRLEQNYPNPFNPSTKIKFSIPESGHYTLKIYDAIGREITTLIDADLAAGIQETSFNAGNHNLPSGLYFYTLTGRNISLTKKMVLLK